MSIVNGYVTYVRFSKHIFLPLFASVTKFFMYIGIPFGSDFQTKAFSRTPLATNYSTATVTD